ncbi:MAG: POTRA domain-containing protein, partial [Bacteroidota bacterium]
MIWVSGFRGTDRLRAGLLAPVTMLLFCLCISARAQPVTDIEFVGMHGSAPVYLERFLAVTEGVEFDSVSVAEDLQRLRDLDRFASVSVERTDDGGLRYTLDEYPSVIPKLGFGSAAGTFWAQAGGVDVNWLGRGFHLGGMVRYYERTSAEVYGRFPTLVGRFGLTFSGGYHATREPVELAERVRTVMVDRSNVQAAVTYDLLRRPFSDWEVTLRAGGGRLDESYRSAALLGGELEFDKWLLQAGFQARRVSYYDIRLVGLHVDLLGQRVADVGRPFTYGD